MLESELLQEIGQKGTDNQEITIRVIKKPSLLSEILEGLGSDKARIKYGCVTILRLISEKEPQILYPKFSFFIDLMDNDNTFLKWGAIRILANMAAVDSENKLERVFDRYFEPISGPVMITAANVIAGAAKMALAKPQLAEEIAKRLLRIENAEYQTMECRNVALGHVIKSFDYFFNQIEDKEPVVTLIRKQLKNTRNPTRRKAERFAKKHRIMIS